MQKRRNARPIPLTAAEAAAYRKQIAAMADAWTPGDEEKEAAWRIAYPEFSMASGLGKAICASYSDAMLLEILRRTAEDLGHAPTKGEMFYLYRIYLKSRFRTWPAALHAAGMRQMPIPDLLMPDWVQMQREEPEVCEALQDVIDRNHRLGYPPRKRDIPQAKILCERFCSWENVIAAADSLEKWQKGRGTAVYK